MHIDYSSLKVILVISCVCSITFSTALSICIGGKFKYKLLFYALAPSGPPTNIKTTSRTTSSLSLTWDPPKKDKQNDVIISYSACVSHSENGSCFQKFIFHTRKWDVRNLNPSTAYYVRVLASNKAGDGPYSESKEFLTNASK